MTFSPYSFSKISLGQQCLRKFKYRYIDKLPVQDIDKTALYKGRAVHSMLEKYPEDSTDSLSSKYRYILDNFLSTKYSKFLHIPSKREQSIALSKEFVPCEYNDSSALFRGYIDYFTVYNNYIIIIDWKTGKYRDIKYQNFNQLMFYAIYMFQKYTKIDTIIVQYIYVEHNLDNSIVFERKYLDNYISELNTQIEYIENTKDFPKNKTKLCDYCEYKNYCTNDI